MSMARRSKPTRGVSEKTGGGGCLKRGHIKWSAFKRGTKQYKCMVILSDLPYQVIISVEVWVGNMMTPLKGVLREDEHGKDSFDRELNLVCVFFF